jgi:hypothetical protein
MIQLRRAALALVFAGLGFAAPTVAAGHTSRATLGAGSSCRSTRLTPGRPRSECDDRTSERPGHSLDRLHLADHEAAPGVDGVGYWPLPPRRSPPRTSTG